MPLKPPQRDATGATLPHDDLDIGDEDGVIRRVSEQQLITDEKTGRRRISSILLKPSNGNNGGMSVDLQRLIEEAGVDARQFVTTPRWMGSIRFRAGQFRAESMLVGYNGIEGNPYHGEVWGNFTKGAQKRLFTVCEWFVSIEDVDIPGAK